MSAPAGPAAGDQGAGGERHWRALEALYASAPVNKMFPSRLQIPERGSSRIDICFSQEMYHAAGAAHGTAYFKCLDDAAFYAVSTIVPHHFILTTAFSLDFTRPAPAGDYVALGRWTNGTRRVLLGEAVLQDASGQVVAMGHGSFTPSRTRLSSLPAYQQALA